MNADERRRFEMDRLLDEVEELLLRGDRSVWELAEKKLREVRAGGGATARLWCTTGVLHHLQGRRSEARASFERAIILDPNSVEPRENLAALDAVQAAPVAIDPVPAEAPAPRLDAKSAAASVPDISIIIPTHGRPSILRRLLQELDLQTIDPGRFEVIVVDDGSRVPVAPQLADLRPRYHLLMLRQERSGPGPARNRAIAASRADRLLILNDDAVPAKDLVAGHLQMLEKHGPSKAVLGSFPWTASSRRSRFLRLLEDRDLIFHFGKMNHTETYEWCFFWTCNISLYKEHVLAVGGFDPFFDEPMSEDVELGWRLFRDRDVEIRYERSLVCQHDHDMKVADFVRRQRMFGRNQYRLFEKYGNPTPLFLGWLGPYDDRLFARARRRYEELCRVTKDFEQRLEAWDAGTTPLVPGTDMDDPANVDLGYDVCQFISLREVMAGVLEMRGRRQAAAGTQPTCVGAAGNSFQADPKALPLQPI